MKAPFIFFNEKIDCENCGNNPVPHFLNWYFESMNIFLTPLRIKLFYNPTSFKIKSFFVPINFSLFFEKVFYNLKIISHQKNIEKCKVSRAKVLWEEAGKRGIIFTELLIFGQSFDTYKAEKNGNIIVFSGLPRPKNYNDSVLEILDDKYECKQILAKNNFPVPKGGSVTSYSEALKIFNLVLKPVIVKPRSGSRGRHCTTFIFTENELKRAFKIAKKLCFWVIVEEHLAGPVYRATVINYELKGLLRGDSPFVTGDGLQTVLELVEQKNNINILEVKKIILDNNVSKFLKRQNKTLESVLEVGEIVTLTEKIGVSYGGSSSEDIEKAHKINKDLFEQAAKSLGDPIVGFDFIIPDITNPFTLQRTGFLEANSLPFINLHHHPQFGPPQNVAEAVWKMVGF